MWTMLAGVPGKLKTMLDRLTATRAANLDKLDANVSTRAAAATALSNAVWTDALAAALSAKTWRSQTWLSNGTFVVPAGVSTVLVSMCAAGGKCTTGTTNSGNGGAGGYYIKYPLSVTPGETLTVTVGQDSATYNLRSSTVAGGTALLQANGGGDATTNTGGDGGWPNGSGGGVNNSTGGSVGGVGIAKTHSTEGGGFIYAGPGPGTGELAGGRLFGARTPFPGYGHGAPAAAVAVNPGAGIVILEWM